MKLLLTILYTPTRCIGFCCSSIKIWKHINLHLHIHKLSQNSFHDSFSHRRPFKIMPKCPHKVHCYHLPANPLRVHGAIFKRHSWWECRQPDLQKTCASSPRAWGSATSSRKDSVHWPTDSSGGSRAHSRASALANYYSVFSVSNIGTADLPGKWHWELA